MVVPVETGNTFDRGTPRPLFPDVYHDTAGTQWDISPDGQRFLMIKSNDGSATGDQIIVVQHWFDELRRLVPTP